MNTSNVYQNNHPLCSANLSGDYVKVVLRLSSGPRVPGFEPLLGTVCVILGKSLQLSKPHLPH